MSPKIVLMVAFVALGFAFLYFSRLNLDASMGHFALARVFQMAAQPFLFITLTTVGYVGIPPDQSGQASAAINLMRNLGGSVGVSFATTAVIWRTQYHHVRLSEHVTPFSPLVQSLGRVGLSAAQSLVQVNATILSYLDVYWMFGVLAFCMAPLALVIKTPPKGAAGGH